MRPTGPTHNMVKKAKYDTKIHWFVSEASEVAFVDNELKTPWRSKLIRYIHSTNTQFILGCLLLLDVAVLFTEVFLDAHFPPCYSIKAHAVCQNESTIGDDWQVQCVGRPSTVESVQEGLYIASILILSIFELELFLLVITLKSQFFRNCGYYLDVVIVTTSLALEVTLHSSQDASAATAVIFARIWRLIRIGHGIFAGKRRQLVMGMLADEELPEKDLWEEGYEEEDLARRRPSSFRMVSHVMRVHDADPESSKTEP